jgi:hypothetical protein
VKAPALAALAPEERASRSAGKLNEDSGEAER